MYERRGLAGGLGYSRERLLAVWDGRLEILQLRQMIKTSAPVKQFGEDFLWVLLGEEARAPLMFLDAARFMPCRQARRLFTIL